MTRKSKEQRILRIIGFSMIILAAFFIGILVEMIYEDDCENYDGCWASVKSGGEKNDWVCVNVKGMSYDRMVEVCQHEAGHEIFAEMCENDIDKCFEVVDNLSS